MSTSQSNPMVKVVYYGVRSAQKKFLFLKLGPNGLLLYSQVDIISNIPC